MSNLRQWRNGQNPKISQVDLATLLETTQSHVSEIENSEDTISLELAAKIFAKTGVRVGRMRDATDEQAQVIAQVAAQ